MFNYNERPNKNRGGADVIITSPPYNISPKAQKNPTEYQLKNHDVKYECYLDNLGFQDYIDWVIQIFISMDKILNSQGTILWNMSYGNDKKLKSVNMGLLWVTISEVIQKTNFTVADMITWKKSNAFPDNVSSNKLTRITENIFVFCRKTEFLTFYMNKEVSKIQERTQQKFYKPIYNFIEAPNNDGSCDLNKATFSSELVEKLLKIYARPKSVIYDPFMGTGTTAIACDTLGFDCYGSEISKNQVDYSWDRLAIHRYQQRRRKQ